MTTNDDDESDDDMNEADLQQLMKSIKAQKQKEGGVTAADSEEDSDEDDEEEEDSDENDVKPDQNKLKEAMKQIKGTPKPQGGKNQQQNQQQKSAQKPNQQQQQKGKGQNNSPGNKFGGKNTPNQTPGKKTASHVRTLQGGVVCEDVVEGSGEVCKKGQRVRVAYVGRLLPTNKEFDRSNKFAFKLGKGDVIKGWDVGFEGMRVGGKRKLIIPPSMGYGFQRSGPIPPNSTLQFEVELKGVS